MWFFIISSITGTLFKKCHKSEHSCKKTTFAAFLSKLWYIGHWKNTSLTEHVGYLVIRLSTGCMTTYIEKESIQQETNFIFVKAFEIILCQYMCVMFICIYIKIYVCMYLCTYFQKISNFFVFTPHFYGKTGVNETINWWRPHA